MHFGAGAQAWATSLQSPPMGGRWTQEPLRAFGGIKPMEARGLERALNSLAQETRKLVSRAPEATQAEALGQSCHSTGCRLPPSFSLSCRFTHAAIGVHPADVPCHGGGKRLFTTWSLPARAPYCIHTGRCAATSQPFCCLIESASRGETSCPTTWHLSPGSLLHGSHTWSLGPALSQSLGSRFTGEGRGSATSPPEATQSTRLSAPAPPTDQS